MNWKKKVRKQFRNLVMRRDAYACRCCGKIGRDRNETPDEEETLYHWTQFHWQIKDDSVLVELDAHHITDRNDMPNGGYVMENGITVCPECHEKAEKHHQGLPCEPDFTPDALYAKIGSSYEKAVLASEKLANE